MNWTSALSKDACLISSPNPGERCKLLRLLPRLLCKPPVGHLLRRSPIRLSEAPNHLVQLTESSSLSFYLLIVGRRRPRAVRPSIHTLREEHVSIALRKKAGYKSEVLGRAKARIREFSNLGDSRWFFRPTRDSIERTWSTMLDQRENYMRNPFEEPRKESYMIKCRMIEEIQSMLHFTLR